MSYSPVEDEFSNKSLQEYKQIIEKLEQDLRIKAAQLQELKLKISNQDSQIENLEIVNQQITTESQRIVKQLQQDNDHLIDLVKLKDLLIEDMKSQLLSHKQIVRTQEEKLTLAPDYESEIREVNKRHEQEIQRLKRQQDKRLKESKKQLAYYKKNDVLLGQYEEKIKQQQLEIESYKRQLKSYKPKVDSKLQLLESVQEKQKQLNRMEFEIKKAEVRYQSSQKQITDLQNQVEKLNKELAKPPQEPKPSTSPTDSPRIGYYKKLLISKENELKQLKSRLTRMYHSQVKEKLLEKGFQFERKQYLDKIGELCKNNEELSKNLRKKDLNKTDYKAKDSTLNYIQENIREITNSAVDANYYIKSSQKGEDFLRSHSANSKFRKLYSPVDPTQASSSRFTHRGRKLKSANNKQYETTPRVQIFHYLKGLRKT